MSAPRNHTPTPHRGIPVTTPHLGLPLVVRRAPSPDNYVGTHWLVEGKTPAQFRVENVIKRNKTLKGLQA